MLILLSLVCTSPDLAGTIPDSVVMTRKDRFAPWASLLFPGSGELMRGYQTKGEILLWIDGITIAGVAGFGWDSYQKNNSAIGMAAMNAGANPLNRSSSYLNSMESYMSSDDYNADLLIEARSRYPDDLEKQKEYYEARKIEDEDAWLWKTDSLRLEYFQQRTSMRNSVGAAQILAGVMVLTRVFSVFDVSFFSPPKESRLGLIPQFDNPGVQLVYRF